MPICAVGLFCHVPSLWIPLLLMPDINKGRFQFPAAFFLLAKYR
jgi:hypothetical protein